ncbi:MAG: nickel-dependent lactate racemase [Acidobacteria bacterium]|nr:nickel-dependent lactate racemase [Acidobacteriota bacterium]
MKTTKMKLGNGYVDVSVPEENFLGMIAKEVPAAGMTEEQVVLDALAHPIGTPRLKEIVKPGNTVCVVVSDITRSWQRMWIYLPYIVKELNEAGVQDKDIRFLCALGYHRKHTPEEHGKLLGSNLIDRFRITDHDCEDKGNLIPLGKTSRGTPVIINRIAAEADHLVLTGCCTYHPWVGWAGGKKSILPGISSIESIQKNHLMTMDEHGKQRPEVASGNIKNNPIHLDMLEVAEIVKPSFIFNVIMGYDGKIARAVCGDCIKAHDVGRGIVDELYEVPITELADITISSQGGYPKDIDVCQTGKGIYHTQAATKPGGWIIILSDCTEGIGPPDANTIFLELDNNEDRHREVRKLFTVPKYVSYYMCTAAEKWNIIIVGNGDPALLAKTKIRTAKTVDEALETAFKEAGRSQKIYLMPQGSSALPKLKKI